MNNGGLISSAFLFSFLPFIDRTFFQLDSYSFRRYIKEVRETHKQLKRKIEMKFVIVASVLLTGTFTAVCGVVGKNEKKTARVHVVLEQIETDGLVVEYN